MPTSNGFDRNNYATTRNFSKSNYKIQTNTIKEFDNNKRVIQVHQAPSISSFYSQPQTSPQSMHSIPMDPNYVYIEDPVLRDLIILLIKSEKDRTKHNMSPNVLTQIDYKNYSLLLSKTSSKPFDDFYAYLDKKETIPLKENRSTQTEFNKDTISNPVISILKKYPSTLEFSTQTQTDDYLLNPKSALKTPVLKNLNNKDQIDAKFYISEIFNEKSGQTYSNPKSAEIPEEVTSIIEKDLANNPVDKDQRTYKIVLNKNITKPDQEPDVLRVLVKKVSQNDPRANSTVSSSVRNNYEIIKPSSTVRFN